jgi:hypothetical protein
MAEFGGNMWGVVNILLNGLTFIPIRRFYEDF